MLHAKNTFNLQRDTIVGWSQNEASQRAAAMAFYALMSTSPLAVLTVALTSNVFGRNVVEGQIFMFLEQAVGEVPARAIEEMITGYSLSTHGVATGVGLAILIYAASALFRNLQSSINAMWGIVPDVQNNVRQNILTILEARLLSASFVVATGFLMIASLLFTTIWAVLPLQALERLVPNWEEFIPIMRLLSSPLIYMVIFSIIFKTLPQASIRWRDVWPGALLTAVLFWVGGYVISNYLSYRAIASVYGAAGSLIAVLFWFYYSSWIILFGAQFTHLYADRYGEPIKPGRGMTFRIYSFVNRKAVVKNPDDTNRQLMV